MLEIAKENNIKICKVPSDWFPTCFYSTELHTIFINQFLSSEEQSRMISCLLDRLGILTPPPDNIYVSIPGGVFIKLFGSGNSLLIRYRHIR